ncbi:hypothetical protein ACFU96_06475 [Streptomyces sp. NPDC057620]|uniref:hypothetical protein n=1 Tax=Streptomyces sp. NPDC057620 TaxID=3346185 RepID=UPI0036C2A5BA
MGAGAGIGAGADAGACPLLTALVAVAEGTTAEGAVAARCTERPLADGAERGTAGRRRG